MRFFRIHYEVLGGHTHTKWFAGKSFEQTMGKCGELTFANEEFTTLRTLLHHAQVAFVDQTKETK